MNDDTRMWIVQHFGEHRPYLLNQERKDHPKTRAQATKYWREAFALEAMASDMPRPLPGPVHIGVSPYTRYRYKQDVGACFPTAKAAIDGLVDAGFLPNDEAEWVNMLTFCAPNIDMPQNGLVLYVRLATT